MPFDRLEKSWYSFRYILAEKFKRGVAHTSLPACVRVRAWPSVSLRFDLVCSPRQTTRTCGSVCRAAAMGSRLAESKPEITAGGNPCLAAMLASTGDKFVSMLTVYSIRRAFSRRKTHVQVHA